MALSDPVERELVHARSITLQGYLRSDGMLDVEARLVDTKPFTFAGDDGTELQAGRPLHEMLVRMTIDEALVIVACEAQTVHGPYSNCGGGAARMGELVGLTIKAGFLRAANERLRGAAGCTHIREMLQQIGTVAHQSRWPARSRQAATEPRDDGSSQINTCFAYAADGPLVRQRWPQRYTGAAAE